MLYKTVKVSFLARELEFFALLRECGWSRSRAKNEIFTVIDGM